MRIKVYYIKGKNQFILDILYGRKGGWRVCIYISTISLISAFIHLNGPLKLGPFEFAKISKHVIILLDLAVTWLKC